VTEKTDDIITVEDKIDNGFLENHVHFINGDINEDSVGKAIRWIVYENLKSEEPLTLYINSDGGNLPDAFALVDVMRMSKSMVRTIGIGSICSSAFLIFAAGTRGQRFVGQNTISMCHQFTDSPTGKYHDLKTKLKENERINNLMVKLLTDCSDLSEKEVKTKLLPPSDIWLSAEELVELGIADSIL
jgi:ATP-dependent Clp protease, protease subunit